MNRATIIGRITKDIELRYTNNNTAFSSISIAINNGKDKNGNERPADFVSVRVWDKMAENLEKYQGKGSKILVEGPIKNDSYTADDGTVKYVTYVRATRIMFLDSASSRNSKNTAEMTYTHTSTSNDLTPADFEQPEQKQMDFMETFDPNDIPF